MIEQLSHIREVLSDLQKERDTCAQLRKENSELSARLGQVEYLLHSQTVAHAEEIRRIIESSEVKIAELEEIANQLEDDNRILQSSIMTYQDRIGDLNRECFLMSAK
jgi:hypothetical protein